MHRSSRALIPNRESAPFLARQLERQAKYLHQSEAVITKAGDSETPKVPQPFSPAAVETPDRGLKRALWRNRHYGLEALVSVHNPDWYRYPPKKSIRLQSPPRE